MDGIVTTGGRRQHLVYDETNSIICFHLYESDVITHNLIKEIKYIINFLEFMNPIFEGINGAVDKSTQYNKNHPNKYKLTGILFAVECVVYNFCQISGFLMLLHQNYKISPKYILLILHLLC